MLTLQPRSQAVYLFNRETFFSEPERWANELREELVLPPPLDCTSSPFPRGSPFLL
jgi:hypothetical protein